MILTFVGGGYAIINRGQVNAGYAVIPSLFTIISVRILSEEKRMNGLYTSIRHFAVKSSNITK